LKSFSPVCIFMWVSTLPFCVKLFPQIWSNKWNIGWRQRRIHYQTTYEQSGPQEQRKRETETRYRIQKNSTTSKVIHVAWYKSGSSLERNIYFIPTAK
jgi:hypothetical protein